MNKLCRALFGAVVGLTVGLTLAIAPGGLRGAADATDDVVDLVVSLLGDKDKDLRAVGLEQVRTEAKGAAATKRFAAELAKISPEAQVGLLSALADRGDSAARPDVVKLFAGSKEPAVRVACITALGLLGEVDDLKLLVPLLASDNKVEKAAARQSLVKLRGETAPKAIAAEIKQTPPATRVALIEILNARRGLDGIPEILAAALDDDATVRAAAMTALGQMATAEHIPGMIRGVLKSAAGAERDNAERSIAAVCNQTKNPQKRAEPLLAAMKVLSPADYDALLPTLGRVGGPEALKIIETAIGDSPRHALGIRSLCNWPDASVAARLIELTTSEQDAKLRAVTLAALIRVAPLPDKRPNDERLALVQKVLGMCSRLEDQNLVLRRAKAIRTIETLRFIMPFTDQPTHAQDACETVVELAHHRELREPNKAEFDKALDKVIATSKDPIVIDRANRYKKGQTWVKPTATPE